MTRYKAQKLTSSKRGIGFKLTFEEWYQWWLSNGIDKNISQGKFNANTLCMCRFKDEGEYELGNIYCATVAENSSHIDKYKHKFSRKTVVSPQGNFNSLKEWCNATGYKAQNFYNRMDSKPNEYYYLE